MQWRDLLTVAEKSDKKRWRGYGSAHPESAPDEFLEKVANKVAWLNEQWTHSLPGDVNDDGTVNVSDATALVNTILGITPMDSNSYYSDIDGNGQINVSDLTALIHIILGTI